jgi:hypothetical protein
MHVPFLRSAPLALLALAATAAPASAADLLSRTVTATGSTTRICHEGLAAGTGIAQRELRMAPLSGTVSAVLSGASGDWDVALFDKATGKAVAGAAGFGAAEVATAATAGSSCRPAAARARARPACSSAARSSPRPASRAPRRS